MSKAILYFILCFALAACTPSQIPVDTDRTEAEIHTLIDAWHQAAAVADEEIYFGSMQEGGIYLGTDKAERWEKAAFEEWSSKYFQRDTAWAFTPYDRQVYFAEDNRTAWFEELLETWMGPCRGSGVLTLKEGQWKIAHYNLAMLIDNADVQDVLQVIKDKAQPPLDRPDSQ